MPSEEKTSEEKRDDIVKKLKIAIQDIGFDTSDTPEGIKITIKDKTKV